MARVPGVPVFLIGGALGDATLAVVGEDPLSEVLTALAPALDGSVPGLGATRSLTC